MSESISRAEKCIPNVESTIHKKNLTSFKYTTLKLQMQQTNATMLNSSWLKPDILQAVVALELLFVICVLYHHSRNQLVLPDGFKHQPTKKLRKSAAWKNLQKWTHLNASTLHETSNLLVGEIEHLDSSTLHHDLQSDDWKKWAKMNHLDGSILHETCNLLVGEIEKLKRK